MNKTDIQLVYEYDRWANNRVLKAVSALTEEQFTRDLGSSFRSVRDTLVHIVGGEWIWLEFWKLRLSAGPAADEEPDPLPFTQNLRAQAVELFKPDKFPSVASVRSKWAEIEMEQSEFVNGLTDEALNRVITMVRPEFTWKYPLWNFMQHLANHSSYHRGQVTVLLRQLGAEPVPLDFIVFLGESRREAAAGS